MPTNKLRTLGRILIILWILFEITMAIKLRNDLVKLDTLTLAFKLLFLITLLYYLGKPLDELTETIALVAPALALLVRIPSTHLSYTFFPSTTVLIGFLASIAILLRGNIRTGASLASVNMLVLVTTIYGLIRYGYFYSSPCNTTIIDTITSLVVAVSTTALAYSWRRHLVPYTLSPLLLLVLCKGLFYIGLV
ncbi:MAG: hypothetical protein F7C36_08075 [Desulfurococcales archaeon]|nr:hypothetical protein [Desulfurococcales archaeon]